METNEAVTALGALAQEIRLAVFQLLVQVGPQGVPVGHIREVLDVAPATLSFHLKELSHAGLVTSRQEGRFIYYTADFERITALMAFLTRNCCQGLTPLCPPGKTLKSGRRARPASSTRSPQRRK